jgi:lambda repressor-like predicted transcriptional regulator
MTPADLRAERARRQVPLYQLAGRVQVHPNTLGRMLAEKIPMPEAVARRVAEALEVGPASGRRGR